MISEGKCEEREKGERGWRSERDSADAAVNEKELGSIIRFIWRWRERLQRSC